MIDDNTKSLYSESISIVDDKQRNILKFAVNGILKTIPRSF